MNKIRIRRLNEPGLARMETLLDSLADPPWNAIDFDRDLRPLLTGSDTTSHVPNVVQAEADSIFPRRYDLAEYLNELVPRLGIADPTRERGLWAWLALLWIEQLAPITAKGRKVGEHAKWLPEAGWKYYRHLVLGPYLIYSTNQDRPKGAMALLHNPPHTPGELVGQLAATQDVAQSRAAIAAATALYYDDARSKLRVGASGSGAGSSRRFRTVLDQLDRTFDLQSVSAESLLELLPAEFDRFRRRT